MQYIITLQLSPPDDTLEFVRNLPWLTDMALDEDYGVVKISSSRGLYVIRVEGTLDEAALLAKPEIKGLYSDMKVAPINIGELNQEN